MSLKVLSCTDPDGVKKPFICICDPQKCSAASNKVEALTKAQFPVMNWQFQCLSSAESLLSNKASGQAALRGFSSLFNHFLPGKM